MSGPKPGWIVLATSIPTFLVAMNNLVVTNALPQIGRALSADLDEMQWVLNAYLLAFAGLMLTAVGIGDRLGRKRVYIAAIVLFTAASIWCALAHSTGELIAARVLQGIAAAPVIPLSLALLSTTLPERNQALGIGLWSGVNGFGVAIGGVVGGAVAQQLGWQWVFLINVPVGLAAVGLLLWTLAETLPSPRRLDVVGMALSTAAVTLLVWATVRSHSSGWASVPVLSALAVAVVLIATFAWWERHTPEPLVPLRLYRNRPFMLVNLLSLTVYFGVFGTYFLFVQYLQGPLGLPPLQAGLWSLPLTVMPLFVAPVVGLAINRVGHGRLVMLASGLLVIGISWIALIASPQIAYGTLFPSLVAVGVGLGLALAIASILVTGSVVPADRGVATGTNSTVAELGGAFGIAVLSTVFQTGMAASSAVDSGVRFLAGMTPAFWGSAAVLAVGVVAGILLSQLRRPQPQW